MAKIHMSEVMEYLENGEDSMGVCLACAEFKEYDVEPDAENYPCENCGEEKVMGLEQYVMLYSF